MATSGGGDDNEWQKLPCDEKVQHKAWKARMTGYEECIKLFRTQDSDKSPEFSKYLGLVKKFVIDPNENAREKALDAVFAFVEEAQVAGKTVGEVAPGLISKCLNGRAKMKDRAFDILLMYVEIEKQVDIEEELVKGLENKQPKIVQACLELLRKGLSEFGSKVLPIKPFLKQVIPLLEDRDKNVRDEAKLLLVEIYKWIGKQTLTPMIQNVKPIQMQELQTEFDKLDLNGADKPRQTRFLRSQQDLKQKMEQTQASTTVSSSVAAEDVNIEMQEDLDPFEMLEAVNILDRLPKDFFDKIESKQWKERKEVLDDLLTLLTQNPKPSPDADYFELIKSLKKVISKDSNIPVVLVAAKCLTALAKGLRKAFKSHAVGVLEVCLDRFREKKTNVIEALRETCDVSYPATNLDQLSEVAVAVLAHKTPIVRQCTQQFLTKCFAMATQTTLPKKVLKIYLPPLIKNTGEADPSVRDSAFESLGMLWKCLGEKHILPNITDLDELKLAKIKEYAENAVLLNARGEPRSSAPVAAAKPAAQPINSATMTKKPTGATVVKPDVTADKDEETTSPAAVAKPAAAPKKKSATTAKPAASKSEPVDEPKREPRPPKASAPTTGVISRVAPSRVKQSVTNTSSSNGKTNLSKVRPVTAPLLSTKITTNVQPRTQRPIALLPTLPTQSTTTTKTQSKPIISTVRRSSFSPTISPSSNLQRQSTSTGGSTSSLSSTNTQGSLPCTRSDTPTLTTTTVMNSTATILRSSSNEIISSPTNTNINTKSRIPVRSEKPIDDPEWQKLAPDEKVQHKLWNARLAGYEECGKLFATQDSSKSGEFEDYLDLLPRFAMDTNENAKEKGLEALLVFIQEAYVARTTVGDIVPTLINKCLSGRPKIKERAFDILLMYIEIDKNAEIEDELIKGLENKQPKIVQASLELLRRALSEFGSKVLPIKPFLPKVIPLLEDRDKTVRDEAKLLLVEIYKWIGKQTLMPMIQNVKPIQMQELQTEFDKLDLNGVDKPRQTRFLRSQQDLKQKMEQTQASTTVSASVAVDDVNVEMQEDVDPFEMMEAANILDRLPKDFFEKIESKQWKDRKEVLDDLLTLLTQNPKPSPEADYFELIKALKKIIAKDSNIPVVLVAAKCLTALAKGLRKSFKSHAVGVLEVCLDRFREKKPNVIEALRETCEASYPSTNLDQLSEVAVTVLAHKTPIVRQCTQQFLTKCFAMATQTTLPKKVLKIYLPALIKNTGEADQSVRDSAFESLGMLWKCLGEKHILPNITDLDELKLNKIKEYAENAVLLNQRGEPRSTAPVTTATSTAAVPKSAGPSINSATMTKKPAGATVVKPDVTADKDEESASPTPAAKSATVAKKKPATTAKPAATTNESAEDKKREPRPPKASVPITGVVPRITSSRVKQSVTNTTSSSSSNGKLNSLKVRPVTAPLLSTKTTTNVQSRTQRPVAFLPTSSTQSTATAATKARPKPITSTVRRSSFSPTVSPSINLERQSTSTGGSTSSLSSTNTQGSLPCTRSDTPTSTITITNSTTTAIVRSSSNDRISSSINTNINTKSRIPVRAIPTTIVRSEKPIDDPEWQKLPPDEKVQHKLWNARLAGYEECGKLFATQDSSKSGEFEDYLDLLPRFAMDTNENAKEKGLEALLVFIQEAYVAKTTVGDIAPTLINKCLSGRPKIKERAFDILLMYIEIDKNAEIEEELIKGLENKQPKIVQASLELLRKGLSEFGSKVLPIKPFLPKVIPLLEDRDKTVRDEAKLLLVEIYKWIGKQTLTPMIQNVKPIQMQELQTEFDKLDLNGADKPRQTRFLRSQQNVKQKKEQAAVDGGSGGAMTSAGTDETEAEPQEELDPLEMLEAANILDRLPKEFFEKIESKQWKDRKEVLDELLTLLTQNPKLAPDADYFELVKVLSKIISKDSNIPVVLVTAKCLTALAKGLRKAFKNHAITVLEVCLDRFREKKANVTEALRETCDVSYPGTNLEQMAEIAVAALSHKTPIVRQCTQQFLTKCFAMATQTTLPKKVLKIYLPPLIKNTGEADPSVRDSAFESLGMLWKCLGEKHILPHVTDLDELKLAKIKEYAEKSILLNARGEPRPPPSAAPPPTITVVKTIKGGGAVIVKPEVVVAEKDDDDEETPPVPSPPAKGSTATTKKKPSAGGKAGAAETADDKKKDVKGKAATTPSGKTSSGSTASTTVKGGKPVSGKGRPTTAPSPSKQSIETESESATSGQQDDQQRPATAHHIQSKIEKKQGQFQLALDDDQMDALRLPDLLSSELPNDFDLPDLPPRTIPTTSIPVSYLAASSDCRQSIDLVIALIADHEVANSLSSLAQIDEVLNDANKCIYLEQHVDKLLRMLSMKLRIAQQNHLYDSSLPSDSVERLFRGILSVLLDLFSRSHLAKIATRDTLKELLNVLLPFVVVTITPSTINTHNTTSRIDASSNEDFIRIVNVIVLKILQHAHMTNVLTALIRLLTECCLQNDFSINDPFVKLVLKCHYRLVRMFPLSLKNNPTEIDATQILIEISSFLKQLPSRRWQSSPNNDFPLRIIKTYLQQLVDERQRLILDDLSRIPNDQQPISDEMRHYIHRKLKALTVSSNNEQVTQQHQTMLKGIFQKFARREQVKVGLEELYDFKLRFPNVDINPFLATTADAFQKFIHEGLARVHAQRTATASAAASTTTNLTSPTSTVLRDKTQTLTSIPIQSSPNSFYSQYAQIHEEKLRALKEQFVWIDTLPTSTNIEQQKPLSDDDFITIYNKRMAAIKEKFRDQLGNTFASSSTPIDPQVYAQHLTQMRQQCGLVATPITTGQDPFDAEVESRLNNGGAAAGGGTTGVNARLAALRSNKTSEPQAESSPSLSAPIDPSAQRTRELLRQRLERVKQGIIE